jgi:hypothetical protein
MFSRCVVKKPWLLYVLELTSSEDTPLEQEKYLHDMELSK